MAGAVLTVSTQLKLGHMILVTHPHYACTEQQRGSVAAPLRPVYHQLTHALLREMRSSRTSASRLKPEALSRRHLALECTQTTSRRLRRLCSAGFIDLSAS